MNSPMYTIIKAVIEKGGNKLSDLIFNIRKEYWYKNITDVECEELIEFANQVASPEAERPEILKMIEALAERVRTIEVWKAEKEAENGDGSDIPTDSTYPEWKPWDGTGTDYQKGAIVQHNGMLWQSVYTGQNVWEPGVVDTRFWINYTE